MNMNLIETGSGKKSSPDDAAGEPIVRSDEILEIASATPFFLGMKPEHITLAFQEARKRKYKAGELLIRQGEPANEFIIIMKGTVAIEAKEAPAASRSIQVLSPHEMLGWSWLFQPFVWHFQARALIPTEVVVLSGGHLLVAAEKDHTFGYDLMKRVSHLVIERLHYTRRQLVPH